MRIARAVASAATLAVLVIGVPLALIAFGRLPGWSELADLPGEALTDTTAFGLLTAVAWVAWALFVLAVVHELVVAVVGPRRFRLPAGAPFQASARRLVAALTMTASLGGSLVGRVGLLPGPAVPAAEATSTSATRLESVGLAAHAVSSAPRSVEALQGVPAPAPHSNLAPVAADVVDGPSVTVAVGDTPWGLAERHLGRGLRWRELWELNRGRPQPDSRAWVAEDLIFPGWQLRLPADATDVPPPRPAPAPAAVPDGDHDDSGADSPAEDAGQVDPGAVTGGESGPEGLPDRPAPSATAPPPAEPTVGEEPALGVPALLGITGATVAATALAYEIRRRRQRRSAISAHADWHPGHNDDVETEHAIAAASDLPLVRWAGHHIANLVATHPPGRLDGAPVAVELSEEAGIEVLWDAPNPAAPQPWSATDGGWAWRLPYDPDGPVPVNDQPAGLPGLVTIGRRDGRQLLVDLEAFGSLAIDGDPGRALDLVRAIAFELGTSEELASAQLVLAGIDIPGAAQLPRAGTVQGDDPVGLVRSTVESLDDALGRSYAPSTFDYRLGGDAWTDVITVVTSAEHPGAAALVEASQPRRGVATVAVGRVPGSGASVTVGSDGTARLEAPQLATPITFDSAGLPADSADAVSSLLDALDQPVAEPAPAGSATSGEFPFAMEPLPFGSGDGRDQSDERGETGGGGADEPPTDHDERATQAGLPDDEAESPARPELLVKVLGTPHVPARPKLKRRPLQLVVYLASMGEPTPAGRVQHAVWHGRGVATKTIWNTATRTRAELGLLGDGAPAMPKSRRDHNTLAVDPRVRTDLQFLQELYTHAQGASSVRAIELLSEGLGLIEGQPFDGPDYEWAHHSELLVAEATKLIEDAALHLVDLASDAGRTDLARFAVTQGLRALRGNEFLYRARMRIEYEAGNLSAVRAAYAELVSFLADIDAEPSRPTIDLYRRLIGRSGRQAS